MPRQIFNAVPKPSAQNRAAVTAATRRTGRGFTEDDTEPEEENYEPEPDIDIEDPTQGEDDEAPEYDEGDGAPRQEGEWLPVFRVNPIWLWRGGRIVWSADRFGYHLAQREHFRHRIQKILDHLRNVMGTDFPEAAAPLLLQGFFTKASLDPEGNKVKGSSWTMRLGQVGLVVDKKLVPLDFFIMGQGKKMPGTLERTWIEMQLRRRGIRKPEWKNFAAWLPEEINTFYAALNDCAGTHFPPYELATLQRKKLLEWRQWDIWDGEDKG